MGGEERRNDGAGRSGGAAGWGGAEGRRGKMAAGEGNSGRAARRGGTEGLRAGGVGWGYVVGEERHDRGDREGMDGR